MILNIHQLTIKLFGGNEVNVALTIKSIKMKKISLLLFLFLILSAVTMAQERGGGQRPSRNQEQGRSGGGARGDRPQLSPEEMVKRQTQRLVEQLKLTKEQETKVAAINKKYMEKQSFDWSKMRDASDDERAKMREERMKIQAEKDKEIKTILNAEQVKLYDEQIKRRQEMMRNGGGRMGGQ